MHQHIGHRHTTAENIGKALILGVVLNGIYTIIEVYIGLHAHSLSLLSDAGHNFGDIFSMGIAWIAIFLGRRQPSINRTYGWRRASILAAFANSLLLVAITGGLAWEAIIRFQHPEPVQGGLVSIAALAGALINAMVAMLLIRGSHDMNIKAAFLHAATDAAVSFGVVLAGIAIIFTGWSWLDPVSSLLIGIIVLISTWDLLKDSINLMLDAVPQHIHLPHLRSHVVKIPGVRGIHQLHIWNVSTTETALTAHLTINPEVAQPDDLLRFICHDLQEHFGIHHITLQCEHPRTGRRCIVEETHHH